MRCTAISWTEIEELRDEVADLRGHVEHSSIRGVHESFILRQLDLIDRAIVEFVLAGPEVVEQMTKEVVGAIGIEATVNPESPAKEYFGPLLGILGKLNTTVQTSETMQKLGSAGKSVAKFASTLLLGSDGGGG